MTSRTPMGVQPRPPQRTQSGSALPVQRPSHQPRSLSQQFVPQSPVRKESFVDLSGDAADASQSRHAAGSTPRRGGSRLKLELSNEGAGGIMSAMDSPRSLTPSRMMALTESVDSGSAMSPAMSRTSQQDLDNPPMPMPKRRAPTSLRVHALRDSNAPPATGKKDGRPKPYTLEIPHAAPRYSSSHKHDPIHRNEATHRDPFSRGLFSGHADFFPWSGGHHEDEWNAEAIQKGTWDKASQNEPSSARLAIFPALKQKTGLSALSTIFMGVLNQRRHRGQITVPSTFKPPPRVTLTDTKREVWLKDLANPAISLRRLSRTIPHGIRGRTLLDQCLNKKVPTERAVWLAKCVGANEIRAFKRKGVNGAFVMGGELRWVRDWTVFVEQFMDAVISSFAEPDWKAKVTYAIRLATNLYSEHLLDRDHYLDWIVSGLENSPQSRIPMWLLIAHICWADLVTSRKFGRRLVSALLDHLHIIHNDPDRDILIRLSGHLTNLLKSLLHKTPESFIYLSLWSKYRDTLRANLTNDTATIAAFAEVNARNLRLAVASTASPPAGPSQLVKLLDTTLQGKTGQDFSALCWAACEDKAQLLLTLVEWATSSYRPGLAKVFVASSLIKSWSVFGCDATTAVLKMLDGILTEDVARKRMAYHLITELVRADYFSVPKYLQWLIARGGYHDAAQIDPEDGPCATRLLVELPVYCLSERSKNERANLLRRAGNYSVSSEEQDILNALKHVKHTLGLPLSETEPIAQKKPISLRKLLQTLKMSSSGLRSAIGAHLRDLYVASFEDTSNPLMSPTMFCSVRSILETAEDFSMLAEVLKAVGKFADTDTLASCTDTINANLGVFLAMGVADDLFEVVLERVRSTSQEQGMVARPLLAAATNLAHRLPGRDDIAKQLQQELVQSDRTNAIDACSPVSDSNLASTAQSSDGEVSDEIDKLLANGNSIDHPTMNRFFRNIVPKLEAGWAKSDDSRRVYASLLNRLRVFDVKHFDKLMADWICHIRSLKHRPVLSNMFPLLVSLGCLSIQTLLSTANASPPTTDIAGSDLAPDYHGSATYLQELVQLITTKLPSGTDLTDEEAYGFYIQQNVAKSDLSTSLLALVRNIVVEYSQLKASSASIDLPLDDETCQGAVLDTLRILAVVDSGAVAEALNIKSLPAEATKLVYKIVSKLLVPQDEGDGQTSFDEILSLANELTMPFCHLKLNLELSMGQLEMDESEEQKSSRFDLFAQAMDHAIEDRNIMWTSMLPCLSEDITQHLKSQAYGRFLDLIPSPKSPSLGEDATSEHRIHLAQNLLGVVEAIISGQPPSKAVQLTTTLAEKLSDLWEIISVKDAENATVQASVLDHWLPALLRFITIHSTSSESPLPVSASTPGAATTTKAAPPPGTEARARIILVLCGLLLDLESLSSHVLGTLPQQVFDIAGLLVDALPEDARLQCAKTILLNPGAMPSTATSSDPRLYYLFSAPQPSRADSLMLAHRDKAGMPHSAAIRGMGAMYGIGPATQEKLSPFVLRRWELLSEPTPNVGENDTSLSLGMFEAIKIQ